MSIPSLTSLLKQSDITDHEEVLAAANAALKTNKSDIQAQHVKLIALLKLDRFEDAVRVVETGDAKLKELAKLEYAYALYKSGKRKAAADIAHASTSRGLKHIEAQALYGLEQFVEASELYKSLNGPGWQQSGDNQADLRVNTLAVNAQLEWNNLGQHVEEKFMTREDFEAHETVYNTVCISIARGETGRCEVLLNRAKYLCEKLEDMSEEDKASELLPITIQHIFILAKEGRLEEAQELSNSIDWSKMPDATTRYLAQVNHEVANINTANPYLLERRLTVDLDSFEPSPAFAFQKAVFARNQYALDLATLKFDGTAAATQASLAKNPKLTIAADTTTLSVVNAAAHAKNKTGKEAIQHIIPLLARRPNDIGLLLTVVQLYVLINNVNAAVELLHNFLTRLQESGDTASLEVRYAPGVVGSIVGLYNAQGRSEQAGAELAAAATYWKGRPADLTPGVIDLLKAAGSASLGAAEPRSGDDSISHSIFELLYQQDPHDRYAAAGLLASSAEADNARSELPKVDGLIKDIDAEALEKTGIQQKVASGQQTYTRKRPATTDPAQTKPKKLRKTKMPKDYDPAKKPDLERWLPLRDRSTYRPKGKKSKARQAMLSQGAVASESDGSRPATPGIDVVKGKPAQGTGGGGGAKKKKPKKK